MSDITHNTATPLRSGDRVLRFPELQARIGLSRSHIHQLITEGRFPRPLKLVEGGRASGFLESEIDAWLSQRAAERDAVKVA